MEGDGRGRLAWVLVLEFCKVVDILVDNNVEIIGLVVRCDLAGCKCLPHYACVPVL
jgi:hypothetical protein